MGIADLAAKSEVQLNLMTKADLIDAILSERSDTTIKERTELPGHGMLRMVTETRGYKGNVTGTRQTDWTYWSAGNVRDITITEKDGAGKEISKNVVSHPEGGVMHVVSVRPVSSVVAE